MKKGKPKILLYSCIVLYFYLFSTGCTSLKNNSSMRVDAELCAHKYCKDASVNFNTDRIYPNTLEPFEAAFMQYNLGFTAFVSNVHKDRKISDDDKKAIHLTRRGSIELHLRTDFWYNPIKEKIEVLPSYYSGKWFRELSKIYNDGLSGGKKKRFPNHGQELFDLTNGKYGFDVSSNRAGRNRLNEFITFFESEKEYVEKLRNNEKVISLSYGNGQTGCAPILKKLNLICSGRNSYYEKEDVNKTVSYYGKLDGNVLGNSPTSQFNESDFKISRGSTTRLMAATIKNRKIDEVDFEHSTDFCIQSLELTLNKNGFYSSFAHWNYFYGPSSPYTSEDFRSKFIEFIRRTREKIDELGKSVYSDSFENIVAYSESRSKVSSVSAIAKKDKIELKITRNKGAGKFILNDYPLSIKLNLNNTEFSNLDIHTDNPKVSGIEKLSNNEFVINLSLNNPNKNVIIDFYKTNSPEYLDFSIPEIQEQNIDSSSINITTDQKTNLVLFIKNKDDFSDFRVLKRSNANSNVHVIDVKSNDLYFSMGQIKKRQLYAGIINPITKQSTLIKINDPTD